MVLLSVFLRRFRWALEGFFFLWTMTGSPVSSKELSSCGRVPTRGPSSECSLFHSSPSSVIRRGHEGWGVPGLVASYDIWPGDRVGLFEAPEPIRGDSMSYSTSCPISTGICVHLRAGKPSSMSVKWEPASAKKAKAGMVRSVCKQTRGCAMPYVHEHFWSGSPKKRHHIECPHIYLV